MPKINIEIPTDLHAQLKAHPFMSISQLCRLGVEMAIQRFPPTLLDPSLSLEQATGTMRPAQAQPRSTPSPISEPSSTPTPPSNPAPHLTGKVKSLDPIGDALKPTPDKRTGLTWFRVDGLLAYTGLARATLESVLDPAEDLDRDGEDNEILDTAAINRVLDNAPSKSWPSLDRYHALASWLTERAA